MPSEDDGCVVHLSIAFDRRQRSRAGVHRYVGLMDCVRLGASGEARRLFTVEVATAVDDDFTAHGPWDIHFSYSVGKGVLPFKAGILENTSAMKSMNTIARVGRSLLAT